jgi:hypothetical protein
MGLFGDDDLDIFLENLARHGLEHYRYLYGIYRGFVVSNRDPENRGRIFPGAGPDRGTFWPPEQGDTIWVQFDIGRADRPKYYTGGWHGEEDVPSEFVTDENDLPNRRGFITRMGHMLLFDDTPDEEALSLIWHKADAGDPARANRLLSADRAIGECAMIRFNPAGDVFISNKIGAQIHMDAENGEIKILSPKGKKENAAVIHMSEAGVKVSDDKGTNYIQIEDGKITIASPGDVTVQAPVFTSETGGTNLSKGSREKIVLGETYTSARGQMNGQVSTALQNSGIGWTAIGPVAQALVGVLSAPPFSLGLPATGGTLPAVLIPLIGALAQAGTSVGPTHTSASVAIKTFEAKAQTYLSKVTKSA